MSNKRFKIHACVAAGVFLLAVGLLVLYLSASPGFYSEKQHLSRIRKRAEERFLDEGSEFTDLEVYPLYNEAERLELVLIEFEPYGYVYVQISNNYLKWLTGVGMYMLSENHPPEPWSPYRKVDGKEEYFLDENGERIYYTDSQFKVAGIENERRYALRVYKDERDKSPSWIPAVKRDEQYLNLTSGELFDYKPGVYSDSYATMRCGFIPKPDFDL